jgi:hypothetical protein
MLQWHPRLIALLAFAVGIASFLGNLRGWGWL